ncbi:uncharacterized protein BO66DRAFT_444224 [Aspergillus aculeatinus CBS 121060]|uniref:Uncharacterized protein n=1 Tax=Aspergillus aculeatinus CBS 121060 TaxID=1448322 RepID=A0ACD1GSF8_9EURO|nr:hypothetical protein BO66DRAFT_444224 [Aspergillus aculeatinus CBS 121060]RAH64208.1 hypothetical protein BO66DRAFT_444224 [Aspergillus aculeatinus CBS 121060]
MCAPVFPDLFEHEEDIDQDEAIRTGEVINQATPPLRTWRKGTALPIFYRHGHESDEDYSDTDEDAETGDDHVEAETGDDHVDAGTGDDQGEGQSQHDGYRDGSAGGVYPTRNPVQVVGLTFNVGGRVVFLLHLRHVEHGRDEVEDEPREECGGDDGQDGEYEGDNEQEGGYEDDEYDEDEEEYGGGGDDDDDDDDDDDGDDGDGDYPSDSDPDHHQHLYGEDEYMCILPDCPERLLIIQERLETRRDFFRDAMVIMYGKYAHLLDVSEMGDDAQAYVPSEKPWESEEARLEWEGFLNRVPQLVCCDADNNLPCSIDDINDFYALRAWMLELLPWVVESPPLAISEAIQTVILMTEPSMAASQASKLRKIRKEMRALLDRLDALEGMNPTNNAKDAAIHGTDSETQNDYTQPVKEKDITAGPRATLNDVLEWFNLRSATYNHERATVFTSKKFPKELSCCTTGTRILQGLDKEAPSKRKEPPQLGAAAPDPAAAAASPSSSSSSCPTEPAIRLHDTPMTATIEQSGPADTQRLRMCATPMLQITHLAETEEPGPFFVVTARPDWGEVAKADFTMVLAIADHNNKLQGKNRILYGMLVTADIVTFAEVSEDVISYGPEVEFAKEEDVVRVCKHVAELLTRGALLGTLLSS